MKYRYCPKCKTEYESWVDKCAECNLPLINYKPKDKKAIKKYGSLWSRFASTVIDSAILGVIMITLRILLYRPLYRFIIPPPNLGYFDPAIRRNQMMFFILIWIVFYIFLTISYTTFFIGKYGSSPGQKITRLKTLMENEKMLGYGKALTRSLVCFILYKLPIASGLFYLISAINIVDEKNEKRQTIHDRICKTIVIYGSK
ncbi:MAG: RDD family protein [Candidatus Omnitrophica bacterium]|nr:RDD family protein [Candidatus Omnitrophota bacterium]